MLEEAKLIDEEYEKKNNRTWGVGFDLDGTWYATSLFWQPLQNQEDPYTEVGEASEGVLEGADLFCIKPGKAPQFGICVSEEGFKTGNQAGAVALATALSDRSSFIAVFKVGNGWWYTCVRNDIILSDGDMLFLNEEEAKEQFMSMLAVPDWGRKIAPPEWEIEDTEYPDLGRLLSKGAKSKLQKIKALRGTKLMLLIGVSAVVGFWLISNIISGIFFTPKKMPVVVPVKPKIVRKVETKPEVRPWESLVAPQAIMHKCANGIAAVQGILPPGWKLGDLTCTPGGIVTTWTRQIGRVSVINHALDKSGVAFARRAVSDNGESVAATIPLGRLQKMPSPPTKNAGDLKYAINDLFQSIGQPITLTNTTYTSPNGTVYRMIGFKFTSQQNPITWSNLLTKFSGLEIKSIIYRIDQKTWEYEGTIYVL